MLISDRLLCNPILNSRLPYLPSPVITSPCETARGHSHAAPVLNVTACFDVFRGVLQSRARQQEVPKRKRRYYRDIVFFLTDKYETALSGADLKKK